MPRKGKRGENNGVLYFSLTIFTVISYFSLYPHLYSRAYINFRNPDDILLFRDRFDGYIFLDSKGWIIGFKKSIIISRYTNEVLLEYPCFYYYYF